MGVAKSRGEIVTIDNHHCLSVCDTVPLWEGGDGGGGEEVIVQVQNHVHA